MALKADLKDLDGQLRSATEGRADIPIVASHPVYQYLARRYDLNIKSVLWEPDQFPEERQWSELTGILRDHPAGNGYRGSAA